MKRIRALGLGVVMALTLMALPAGASAAGGIESEVDPTDLWGETIGAEAEWTFGPEGPGTGCDGLFEDEIGKRANVVTGPTEFECGYAVAMNGCQLEFKPGSENSFGIGPPGCGPIKTTVQLGCKYSIGAQSGFPATYTNAGSGNTADVRIVSSTNNLTFTSESSGFCGGVGKVFKNGSFSAEWELQGFDLNGNQAGIHAVDEFTQGFFITGKESGEKAQQPKFEAEQYPATLVGQQPFGEEFLFETSEGNTPISCPSGQFGAVLSSAASALAINPLLTNCLASYISSVAVDMNSCHFAFDLDNAGPPYSGGLDLACTNGGDAIELWWKIPFAEDCTVIIPAQAPTSSVAYTNQGAGIGRSVHVSYAAEGLKYSYTGNKVCAGAFKGGGLLSGGATLHGSLG